MYWFIFTIFCFVTLLFALSLYITYRSGEVLKFRLKLIELHYIWILKNLNGKKFKKLESVGEFINRISSFNKMLYSFKKITMENWISIEDIIRLN